MGKAIARSRIERLVEGVADLSLSGTLTNLYKTFTVTADKTIAGEDTGTWFVIGATGKTITLPAAEGNRGVHFYFLNGMASTPNVILVGGSPWIGTITSVTGTAISGDGYKKTLTGTSTALGEYIHVVSGGTYWHIIDHNVKANDGWAFST